MPRKDILRGCISIIAGLAIWELLAQPLLENELLIPPPSSVARTFWKLTVTGQLNKHLAATLIEFAYGFTTACVIGVVLGYLMGMHKRFDKTMELRVKEGAYQGKKVPPASDYVENSFIEEALKQLGK